MLIHFLVLGNKQGDVYYVESESAGYVWIDDNGTLRWELLGMTVDTSNFLTKNNLLNTTGNATDNTMSQFAISNYLKGKLLYNNSTGSIDDITLNDDLSKYAYIDIQYKTADGNVDVKRIYDPNGKSVVLSGYHITTNAELTYTRHKIVKLQGTSISNLAGNRFVIYRITNQNTITNWQNTNQLYITKVIGYKT